MKFDKTKILKPFKILYEILKSMQTPKEMEPLEQEMGSFSYSITLLRASKNNKDKKKNKPVEDI